MKSRSGWEASSCEHKSDTIFRSGSCARLDHVLSCEHQSLDIQAMYVQLSLKKSSMPHCGVRIQCTATGIA